MMARSVAIVFACLGLVGGGGPAMADAKTDPVGGKPTKSKKAKSKKAKPRGAPEATDDSMEVAESPKAAGPELSPSGQALMSRVSKMVYSEQRDATNTYLDKMSDGLAKLKRAIDSARDERDIVKLNCLNDRYLQIRAAMKLTHKLKRRMEKANQENKVAARNYLFAKILILFEKVEIKIKQANTCDGKASELEGKTDVQVDTGDAEGAADPTTQTDVPVDPDADWIPFDIVFAGPLFRPPLASPNM